MSSEHNSNQFLTQEYVTSQKTITKEEFTNEVLRIITQSNRAVVLSLVKIKDDIILDGTKFFNDARDTAMIFFDSEYERLILKLSSEEWKATFSKYKESRDTLIEAIIAQPDESKRSIAATAGCSSRSSLLKSIPGITDENQNLVDY